MSTWNELWGHWSDAFTKYKFRISDI